MNRQEIQGIRTASQLDDKLLKCKGVIGVDVDYKEVKGEKTDKFCITVYVKNKLAKEELSADEVVPAEIEGIQTDVVECLNVWPSPESAEQMAAEVKTKQPQTPVLVGGLSISNQFDNGYGTLGVVILSNSVPTALSCAHVMVYPPSQPGQGVIEPGKNQGGTYPADSIGLVTFSRYGLNNVDAALVPILSSRPSSLGVVQNIGTVRDYGSTFIGQQVGKMGATTALTQGWVTSTTLMWRYTTSLGTITLDNQIRVDGTGGSTFALPGDSGSAVINGGLYMVGMVVSGVPNQFTVCNNSTDIVNAIPRVTSFSEEKK